MNFYIKLNLLPFLFLLINFQAICQSENSSDELTKLNAIIDSVDVFSKSQRPSAWPDLSENKLKKEASFYKQVIGDLRNIDSEQLSMTQQVTKDLLLLNLEEEVYHLEFESHLFPLNSEGGFFTSVLYSIRSRLVNDSISYDKYKQDLLAIPNYFNQQKSNLERGIKENKMMPKLVVQHCLDNVNGILKAGPEASFYLDPLTDNERYKKEIIDILSIQIFPAYRDLQSFLEDEYLPKAPAKIGVSEMTEGKSFYEQRVRYYTTYDISPQEVFDTGMKEVARIRSEMELIIKETGFEGSFDEFLSFLRTDPQFYAETPEELLKEAAWITKSMEGMMPKYFGKMPRMPLTVTPVPSALAPNYTSGRYSQGSYKYNKPGEYWVNTYDLNSRPLYALPALSLHEGIPGHHTQIMLAAEMEDIPEFRNFVYLSAFGEGWALYTEYLGKEAGIYDTAYKEFGRLTYEMWRACRLVVDPGMHYMGWTREEALKFMSENTALSFREVNSEIDRYIGWPGQAVSYKMGELKIRALRKLAEEALGDEFNIKEFHDLILSQGSVTMERLEKMVTSYISEKQN